MDNGYSDQDAVCIVNYGWYIVGHFGRLVYCVHAKQCSMLVSYGVVCSEANHGLTRGLHI